MVEFVSRQNTLFLVSKQVLVIILCIVVVVVSICFASFFAFRANFKIRQQKKEALANGQVLYIVIEQYEVQNFKFKPGSSVKVLYEAKFTDDLEYYHRFENEYGYNTVEIKNGEAKIVAADCRDGVCKNQLITNGFKNWFESPSIICYPHGIKIKWEARTS